MNDEDKFVDSAKMVAKQMYDEDGTVVKEH